MVEAELATARKKHPTRFNSLHEGYAILLEEVDEVWDHVRAKKTGSDGGLGGTYSSRCDGPARGGRFGSNF